ncbi:MAG TPA: hypothetical protein VFU92_07575 [Usitatibacter sp.]|jgi:hypothetical protein|nr:hypothetical protein [Usitatibacter sp.]
MKAERKQRPGRRHVHLGERLDAVARVHRGEAIDDVAVDMGVTVDDVAAWVAALVDERTYSLDEIRIGESPERIHLVRRARRLADLVAESERTLRDLHQELIRGISPSNDDDAGASKEVARNSQFRASPVAPSQRDAGFARKFVDGDSTR